MITAHALVTIAELWAGLLLGMAFFFVITVAAVIVAALDHRPERHRPRPPTTSTDQRDHS